MSLKRSLDEIDFQIAARRAFGETHQQIGEQIATAQYPLGLGRDTVGARIKKNPFINDAVRYIMALAQKSQEDFEIKTKKQYYEKIEALRGQMLRARQEGLASEDLDLANKVAAQLEDRLDGRATQTNLNLTAGRIEHEHRISIVPGDILQSLQDAARVIPLQLNPPPQKLIEQVAIEAEIVEDDGLSENAG